MTRSDSTGSEPLRDREEHFATLLSLGVPSLTAGLMAGWKWNGSPAGNAANGRRLSQRPQIRARVAYLRANRNEPVRAELAHIVHDRLMLMHEADIGDFYETVEVEDPDADGNPVWVNGKVRTKVVQRVKPFDRMTPEQRRCVKGLTYTESGRPKLELYSALDANRDLRKMHGLDQAQKLEVDQVSADTEEAINKMVDMVATIALRVQAIDAADNADNETENAE